MTDDPLNQNDPASPPAPSGGPQANGYRNRRKIIIIGAIIAIILIIVFGLPWIAELISGQGGHCECIRFYVNTGVSQPDNETIVATFLGGIGQDTVERMMATVTDSTGHEQTKMIGFERPFSWRDHLWFWDLIFPPGEPPILYSLPPGEKITFNGAFSGKDHVVIIVYTWDREKTVIYDDYV